VLIPRLDLKFVAHHGAFGLQHVAGGEDLSKSDVILVHRLLKNHVAEVIGHAGYALYTDAVVAAMGIDPARLRMRRQEEEVEGIGPVEGWVQDLHERWEEERERRRVKVSRDEAAGVSSYEVPAPRSVTWSYLTDPGLRATWTPGMQRVDQSTPNGRRGIGTQNHCIHGKNASLEEILDWRPFDYYTILNNVRMPLLKPMRMTYELEDVPGGTRVTEYVAPGPGFGQRAIVTAVGRLMAGVFARGQAALRSAVAASQAAPDATRSSGGLLSDPARERS
jgi:uncharacterized protein YndB with AHSA1/START domain